MASPAELQDILYWITSMERADTNSPGVLFVQALALEDEGGSLVATLTRDDNGDYQATDITGAGA